MEIKNVVSYSADVVQQAQDKDQRAAVDDGATGADAAAGADSVKWSSGYQEMTQVKKMDMEGGDIRSDRVEQLRGMIEAGNYVVDPERIANKILEEHW